MPTASRDRKQDIPERIQPLEEGLVEGESGSSSSAGEAIPKTTPPRSCKTLEQICRKTQFVHPFFEGPERMCANAQTSQELHEEAILKVEKVITKFSQ